MRMLASIQKVEKIEPIENADRVEKLSVLGWEVVSAKGTMKEGDLCIYIEIDGLVPDVPHFQFLKAGLNRRWNRIRTKKIRGVVSQGLTLPLSVLDDIGWAGSREIDTDITEALGVEKYEPPSEGGFGGAGRARSWPNFLVKTDEPRVQSSPRILERMKGELCYISIKLDGTSCTFFVNGEAEGVCSRSQLMSVHSDSVYSTVAKELNILERIRSFGNYAVQGEICGPKIQGNKLELKKAAFAAFNAFDIDNKRYLDFEEFKSLCSNLELQTVPILATNLTLNHSKDDLLTLAEGKYNKTTNEREGIVVRTMTESTEGERNSFKVISNRFLLKYEDE